MVRDYDEVNSYVVMVYAAKLLIEHGQEDAFKSYFSKFELDMDEYYQLFCEMVAYTCDEFHSKYNENYGDECLSFFDQGMTDFYKLCLVYNAKHGIKPDQNPNDNPYFKEAAEFVRGQMDFNAYTCDYRLLTDATRKGRCRLIFGHDANFDGAFHLLRGAFNVFGYYRQKAEELRKLLGAQEESNMKEAA